MSWDRKAERSEKFKKRKQSKNKGRAKKHKKEFHEIKSSELDELANQIIL